GGSFRGLRPEDLLLAIRDGDIVGTFGSWDQCDFRQTVVHGYGPPLGWVRPIYNVWARCRGRPRLPGRGDRVGFRGAALPLVADDTLEVFGALPTMALPRLVDADYLLIGLHESDSLLDVVRRWPATWYPTNLFQVCWDDDEAVRRSLDG